MKIPQGRVSLCLASAAAFVGLLYLNPMVATSEPRHLYLTLPEQDASHSLCLNLHIAEASKTKKAYLTVPELQVNAMEVSSERAQFAQQRISCFRFWLKNLKAGHTYQATLRVEGQTWTKSLKLCTPPDRGQLRFVVAGDSLPGSALNQMLAKAQKLKPDFYVYGGDLAYDNGEPSQFHLWDSWMTAVETAANGPNGMVPILAVIGNHEVQGGFLNGTGRLQWDRARPYDFFFHQAQNGTGMQRDNASYGFRNFGKDLGLWFLDSGHLAAPNGTQAQWLAKNLKTNSQYPLKLAAYHVPFYPSSRGPEEGPSQACRHAWGRLFDDYSLTAAFEHHDHAFKRTYPIKAERKDPGGVVYLGDGCIGQAPRPVQSRWYLEKAAPSRNFWFIQVNEKPGWMKSTAMGESGPFDVWETHFRKP
jgi:hypothetical protein